MFHSPDDILDNTSLLFPCTLLPCEEQDKDEPAAVPVPFSPEVEQTATLLSLLRTLLPVLRVTDTVRHPDGYDMAGLTLPVQAFADALETLPGLATLRQAATHWLRRGATTLQVRLPQRCQHLNVRTVVWGHDMQALPAAHHQAVLNQAKNRCRFCAYPSADNQVLVRDGDIANTAGTNLVVACDICALSQRLNTLSASDGVMVWLPELAPAALSHLLRATLTARYQGNEQQKADARQVMAWLVSHRRECEAFWGTSHPGEFGEALLRADPAMREDLLLRLLGAALIPNPALFRHLSPF
jgi:hypothetical protein